MFGWLPIIFQFLAMSSALGAISFATHALDTFVIEHREGLQIPRPTRLLVGHSLLAETIVVALFGVSLFSFWLTPRVVKEEVDRQLIHGAVVGFVWLVGVNYTAGVLMAALLPFFAHRT